MRGRLLLAACTFFSVGLFLSYFLLDGVWGAVDKAVFFFFNVRLIPGSLFLTATAYANMRLFDAMSFLSMALLYYAYFRRQDNAGKRRMISLGMCMLAIGVIIKQCGPLLPVSHPSPTLVFDDVHRLTQLTAVKTKDAAGNSFPGDHGIMLMVFAAFMARYFGRKAFCAAAVFVVVFSLPRIASGAHWFSDIYMGSLAITTFVLSWFLLTGASDSCAAWLERLIPARLYPPEPSAP